MKRLAFLALLLLLGSPRSHACGDKYLVRCAVNRSGAPASGGKLGRVVIVHDGSPLVKRLIDLKIQNDLTARGFRVYVVHSRDELAQVVADGHLDLAIGDFRRIDSYAGALARDTQWLPVIDRSNEAALPALREKHAFVLKVPGTQSTSLATVSLAVRDARKTS